MSDRTWEQISEDAIETLRGHIDRNEDPYLREFIVTDHELCVIRMQPRPNVLLSDQSERICGMRIVRAPDRVLGDL